MRSDEILKRTQEGVKESNKILIEELIYDLETKGISPVISIDGEVRKLQLADENERQDFVHSLSKCGYDAQDFCLLTSGGKCAKNVRVIVYKKTSKLREYKANNPEWLKDFCRDLSEGFFNS